MMMATLPVTIGGRTLSSRAFPIHWISKPNRMLNRPVSRMPTWAIRTPSGQYTVDGSLKQSPAYFDITVMKTVM